MKLIYHKKNEDISEFDTEILKICKNNEVKIVCPYIGLEYFKRIISLTKNWGLVTDIEEWIISHHQNEREKIKNFIIENTAKIHNCKDIHAKVILNKNLALIGSANFTNKGITGRTEVSVLINETEQIRELNQWFYELWENTESVSPNSLNNFIKSAININPNQFNGNKIEYIYTKQPIINKKLSELNNNKLISANNFEINEFYTREFISKILGGDQQSYLPNKGGKVTCCCITGVLNVPDENAPIILVGDAPKVIKSGEMLINQKENIPIFVKKAPNKHRYIGRFKVDKYTEDMKIIEKIRKQVNREDLPVMAIFMKKVSN